ncbi:O-antigen ligase family protein [Salinarimonas ramus]|uniref:O-antigen ligase-related domain-containing protein n=1 Tax=Salinarimonas ramus TaxID=690164 RepID=A0A917Q3J3_9HYPH|nr:O-antigen ligase family protein [Salinarimonas ramus]GGK20291.1 hypothetical protein GCM10011322_03680 [Salinarimonas ramus]
MSAHAKSRSHRLAEVALVVAAAAPLAMVLSRGIAPVLLAVAALVLALSSTLAGRAPAARARFAAFLRAPGGMLALAIAAWMLASLAWTPAFLRGGELALHVVASAVLVAIALANLLVLAPPVRLPGAPVGGLLAAAAVLTIVELTLGSPLRGALGASQEAFRLNRTAVALALFLPLAVTLLLRDGRRAWAIALALVTASAVFVSDSESAKLALLAAGAPSLLARLAPRAAAPIGGGAMLVALFAIPVLAPFVNALVPAALHEAVGYGALGIRGEIWAAYSRLVGESWLVGHGMEAGHVAASFLARGVGAGVDPASAALLDWGHPHNVALQIWFELGLVGVILFAGAIVLAIRVVARLSGALRPAALASATAVFATSYVSHGAWQAWWWCLVGLLVLLYAAAREREARP